MSTKATVIKFDTDTGARLSATKVNVWAVRKDGDLQDFDGICIALADNTDIVVDEETLAAMGYVRG